MGNGMMKYFHVGIATFAVTLMLAGSSANAQAPREEKPDRIDILAAISPKQTNPQIDPLATGAISPGNDVSEFVVGAVLNNNDMLSYCLNISNTTLTRMIIA